MPRAEVIDALKKLHANAISNPMRWVVFSFFFFFLVTWTETWIMVSVRKLRDLEVYLNVGKHDVHELCISPHAGDQSPFAIANL